MGKLYPEDQERVDEYISSNVNSVERKEFRPWLLLGGLLGVLGVLTVIAFWVASRHGL